MFEVRKPVGRAVGIGLFFVSLAALSATSSAQFAAQTTIKKDQAPPPHRRETNAARQARIARTIQETYSHRWEIIGGGGYLRFRSGENTQKNNEVSWATAANYYLNPKLAVVGDIRGSFGNAHTTTNNLFGVYTAQINEYTFMGGVNYRFLEKEKFATSVSVLGGDGWGIFSGGSKGVSSTALGIWPDGNKPAFSVGVNFDYNFYPNLAFRVTPTYVGTTFGSTVQNNVGFNMGVVYRFGRQ